MNTSSTQQSLGYPNPNLAQNALLAIHLVYLLEIYREIFDTNLHAGRYAVDGDQFEITVQELIRMGLIRYEGSHMLTALGVSHVLQILKLTP